MKIGAMIAHFGMTPGMIMSITNDQQDEADQQRQRADVGPAQQVGELVAATLEMFE